MKAYSFINTIVLVNGVPITGWADGDDALNIKRRAEAATDKVGCDGNMAVAFSADKSGEITFKLMQTSPSNKFLNAIYNLQQGGPAKFAPVAVGFKDTYRQDSVGGALGYLSMLPEITRGGGINTQEWKIVVQRLDMLLGDPAFVGFATAVAEAT